MKTTCDIRKGQFVSDKGDVVDYYQYQVEICGETFNLHPKTEDKKLIKHLLKDCDVEAVD